MNCVYRRGKANLFYCNQQEYESIKNNKIDISALLCAKNPFHQKIVGYTKNCPKEHPEYFVAYRPEQHLMALNMIDADKPEFFSDKMIYQGLNFIENELALNRDVVVVCNRGESRSPSMCLLYLMLSECFDPSAEYIEVFSRFKAVARNWTPKNGILQYCINFWSRIKRGERC